MAYTVLGDFRAGVNRTRPIYAANPGTVWSAINGHWTRGGDFEKRKAFQAKYALPANTFGLKATATGLYVFGSVSDPGVPSGTTYQRLQHPDGVTNMSALLWTELFNGKVYAIAQYTDNAVHHFYDGTRITDWDGGTGNPTTKGQIARTLQRKVYSAGGSLLSFSGVDTATGWTEPGDTGAGQINMSNHLAGSEMLTALAVYQSKLAVFSRNAIQVWLMFADPDDNVQDQVLENVGTRAPGSVLSYHEHDVIFLDDSGIRSLRARSDINIAGVEDIGTAVDDLIQTWKDDGTITDADIEAAVAIVEPRDKRLWMVIGPKVLVFTYFRQSKVAAWSWYEPGYTISHLTTFEGKVYARSGNTVYVYGGDNGTTYDSSAVTLRLPYLDSGKIGHFKQYKGLAQAASGAWGVKLYLNPNAPEADYVDMGTLENVTVQEESVAALGNAPLISPEYVHEGAGYASVSKVALYFDGAQSDGGTS